MLILVGKDTFNGGIDSHMGTNELLECAEELGTARYKGFHQVAGPPLLLHQLSGLPSLSQRAQRGLLDAAAWSHKELLRSRQIEPRIELVEMSPGVPPSNLVYRLPWRDIRRSSCMQLAVVGGEHIEDAHYWEMIAKAWLTTRPPDVPLTDSAVRIEHLSLGGGNAFTAVLPSLKAGRQILAVVDSDKEYPDAKNLGSTAENLFKRSVPLWRECLNPWHPFHVQVLPAHAIENLLPSVLVRKVAGQRGAPGLDVLQANLYGGLFCHKEGAPVALRYVNLAKRPHCLSSLQGAKDESLAAHHREIVLLLGERRVASGVANVPAPDGPACVPACHNSGPPAGCWTMPVGKKLLPAVVAAAETLIREEGAEALAMLLPFGSEAEWDALCRTIALWGLGHRGAYA